MPFSRQLCALFALLPGCPSSVRNRPGPSKYSLKSAEGNLSSEYRRSQSLTSKLNIFLTCKDALPYIFHPLVNKHRRVTAVFAALAHPARRRILERLARTRRNPRDRASQALSNFVASDFETLASPG